MMLLLLLQNHKFRSFLIANALERFAASAMVVLLGLQIYGLRHNPLDLGWLGFVEAVPAITLMLYGGHVADRHSRRHIVMITSLLLALLAGGFAALTGAGHGSLTAILLVAFLSGIIRAFESPAASGMEAQVVPIEHLMRGVSVLVTSGRLADMLGPTAGGFAWVWMGQEATYATIGLLFLLASITLLISGTEQSENLYIRNDDESIWSRLTGGLRFVLGNQILFGSMALDLFAVFFGGATALLPAIATDVLHAGPAGLGLLRSAASAGALIAALSAVRVIPERWAGLVLHGAIASFGVSMVVFGLSRSLPLSVLALFVSGLCDGVSMIIRRAIIRLTSPDALRGRISAVRMIFVGSSNELGALESGVAATYLGIAPAIWAGGVATLLIVGFTAIVAPRLRRLNLSELTRAQMERAEAD
jgi:MFS family permease